MSSMKLCVPNDRIIVKYKDIRAQTCLSTGSGSKDAIELWLP